MSDIGMISTGIQAQQAMTQLNISTAVMKNIIDAEKQMAQLMAEVSKASPQLNSSTSGGVDIYA